MTFFQIGSTMVLTRFSLTGTISPVRATRFGSCKESKLRSSESDTDLRSCNVSNPEKKVNAEKIETQTFPTNFNKAARGPG